MLAPMFTVLAKGKLSVLRFQKVPLRSHALKPLEPDLATVTRMLENVQTLFRVIPLSDAMTALRAGMLPARAACISFDDGYGDWTQGVVPVLQRLQLHATFFVATGQFRGQPLWRERILHAVMQVPAGMPVLDLADARLAPLPVSTLDEKRSVVAALESTLKYLPPVERDVLVRRLEQACMISEPGAGVMPEHDVRALHAAGFGIGSQTVSQPILMRCDPVQAWREISESKEQLEGLIGGRVEGFAYPGGVPDVDFSAAHVDMVRRAGYRYAVTTEAGAARTCHSPCHIPRLTLERASSARMVWQFARNLMRAPTVLSDAQAMPRRALMVAFHFPPQFGSSGVLRTANFVKNLPELGWRPDVLTARPAAYEQTRSDLVESIPPMVTVLRAAGLDSARHLSFRGKYLLALALPDRWASWWLPAVWMGWRQARREKVDLVWSTYPIATAHLIGASLAAITRLPWVADFRDPMVSDDHPSGALKRWVWSRLERHVLARAQLCVFTTERAAAVYRQRYPHAAARCVVVENGYDEEQFVGARATRTGVSPGTLLLLHSGLIYPGDRDPSSFFEAVAHLLERGDLHRERLMIRFRAPRHGDEVMQAARQHGIDDIVEIAPPLPHGEAIAEMMGADLLLLFQGSSFNAQIPAKVYEYLRAQRPLMAIVDRQGDTAQLVQGFEQVVVAGIDVPDDNIAALKGWLTARAGADPSAQFLANVEKLASSSRVHHAGMLAAHFDELVK